MEEWYPQKFAIRREGTEIFLEIIRSLPNELEAFYRIRVSYESLKSIRDHVEMFLKNEDLYLDLGFSPDRRTGLKPILNRDGTQNLYRVIVEALDSPKMWR